jgi:hypothetical protein
MARVASVAQFDGTVAEAEALWFDRRRWVSFIDGFDHVEKLDPDWPAVGSRLLWASNPHGRGLVSESVTGYEPGERQTADVEDSKLRGVQTVEFEQLDGGVEVRLSLEYAIKDTNVFTPIVDLFFVRRSLTEALTRTLQRFGRELEADLELLR